MEPILNSHDKLEYEPAHSSDFDTLLTFFHTMGVYWLI